MSPSPSSLQDKAGVGNYTSGWRDTMRMVRSGVSWSGREKNCVFLNTLGDPKSESRFANVSAVSGLDFPDDARGLALVDWDHDGDLDVWFRNRSGPRLRLMRNGTGESEKRRYVAVRLQGTDCNRDAIGAVAWLSTPSSHNERLQQTVRAGDGFLSQSSKWLHFGIGKDEIADKLTVNWPGGKEESFLGVQVGNHYIAKQGSGRLEKWSRSKQVKLSSEPNAELPLTAAARIVLPAKIPMTLINWRDENGNEVGSPLKGQPTLVSFWTSSCPNCRRELQSFHSESERILSAGLNVVGIRIDDLLADLVKDDAGQFVSLNAKLNFQSTEATMERIRSLQNSLFNMYPPSVVPISFLLDSGSNIVTIYRGAFDIDVFLGDLDLTNNITTKERRDRAVPLNGRWFTNPASDSEFIELVAKKMYRMDQDQAMRYFEAAMSMASDETRRDRLQDQLVQSYLKLAKQAADSPSAIENFHNAIRLSPEKTKPLVHHEFGIYYAKSGDFDNATAQLEIAIKLRPNYPAAQQNLRLILDQKKK